MTSLLLDGCSGEAALQHLRRLSALAELQLLDKGLTSVELTQLHGPAQSAACGDAALCVLVRAGWASLRVLGMRNCGSLSYAGVAAVRLALQACRHCSACTSPASLPRLSTLSLKGCAALSDSSLVHLAALCRLAELRLQGGRVSDQGLALIARVPRDGGP